MVDRSPIPMTAEGLQKVRDEHDHLIGAGRREVTQRIQAARELGDLRENAEYDIAKNDQGLMEARIRQLEDIIKRAVIMDDSQSHGRAAVVTIGATVTIDFGGDEETYTIVSPVEAKPREGRISNESPVGKALLGHKVGDKFDITMPNGRKIATTVKGITR
jgi:transcription elongation factor GreA